MKPLVAPREETRLCPPGITIAVPNWNHELVLPRAIQSGLQALAYLREQGVLGELLVIDDASRDGSLVLLRQLEALLFDEGLRVLALTQNGGLSAARHHALLHARYRHIIFMDADNELVPENTFQFYRASQATGAAVVYGNLICVDGKTAPRLLSNESFQYRMFGENYIDAFALYDRLQALDSGSFIQTLGPEDWEFFLHLATSGKLIVFVPLVFGMYHDVPFSMYKDQAPNIDTYLRRSRRMFNQFGIRPQLPLNTRHKRYHPDLGYL